MYIYIFEKQPVNPEMIWSQVLFMRQLDDQHMEDYRAWQFLEGSDCPRSAWSMCMDSVCMDVRWWTCNWNMSLLGRYIHTYICIYCTYYVFYMCWFAIEKCYNVRTAKFDFESWYYHIILKWYDISIFTMLRYSNIWYNVS